MTSNDFFLSVPENQWVTSNDLSFALWDGYPVSRGHALIIPKRPVKDWFAASQEEQLSMMSLVNEMKHIIIDEIGDEPDGWNVGFNAGAAAGQTIFHCHIHIIPRWHGDMDDPRGGVRHVIPSKGNYKLLTTSDLSVGYPDDPLLSRLLNDLHGACSVDILTAFVQPSGVDLLNAHILRLLAQKDNTAHIRILTGDYLGISHPHALRRLLALSELGENERSRCDMRVLEMSSLPKGTASFHPKSWRIEHVDKTIVWVGSSNLSAAALSTGVEWNLRTTSSEKPATCKRVAEEFNRLWDMATSVDAEWISRYEKNRPKMVPNKSAQPHVLSEIQNTDDTDIVWEPRLWQKTVLASLTHLRQREHNRALAIVATGMGKTVLAALDAQQFLETRTSAKILVISHRAEILMQAASTIRSVLSWEETMESWYLKDQSDMSGNIVLASIQKLSRPEGCELLKKQHFDYAIIDEVHHAEAPTWRRVLACLHSDFTIGLTATPERSDGKHIATLFDDIIACDISIADGIEEDSLVPFHYIGIVDDVDYRHIPWRSGRFSPSELEHALIHNSDRYQRLLHTMHEHPGNRTLLFCCSKKHAQFVSDWLCQHNIASVAVFSGTGSADRSTAIQQLESGSIQALCSVDLFNEGIDIPTVDRIIMLRPTESGIVLTQQLGRGLRASHGKTRLIVIDFVGNHKMFLWRIQHIMSLGGLVGDTQTVRDFLSGKPLELANECHIDIDLEAKEVLSAFLPSGKGAVKDAVVHVAEELQRRPTASEMHHRGYLINTLHAQHNGWFHFLSSQSLLNTQEKEVLDLYAKWLSWIETTNMTRSWKMIVLRVLCDSDSLLEQHDILTHARLARKLMRAHPVLKNDMTDEHRTCSEKKWAQHWLKMPLSKSGQWIDLHGDSFSYTLPSHPHLRESLTAMTAEIVDWRIARYTSQQTAKKISGGCLAKVSHSSGKAIIRLPTIQECPNRPTGTQIVLLPNGEQWEFRFVKIACNVAHPIGEKTNQLSTLLKEWFGTDAGKPGTSFQLSLHYDNDSKQWTIAPLHIQLPVLQLPVNETEGLPGNILFEQPTEGIPVYDLVAAAGLFSGAQNVADTDVLGWISCENRVSRDGDFIVQIRGHSMEPLIADGSWCLFRPHVSGSRENRILLVQHHALGDADNGGEFTVKRYRSEKAPSTEYDWAHTSISLHPENPDYQPIILDPQHIEDMKIIGEFKGII